MEQNLNRDYSGCPFCHLPQKRILLSNAYGIAIRDAYPVSVGHTLILPHRHVASFFEIKPEERMALLDLLDEARITLDKLNRPEGYNIRCQPWRAKRRLVDPSSREAALFSRRALRQRENKVGLRTR
ncbi:HIT family protein, partial [Thiolapillus sp.]